MSDVRPNIPELGSVKTAVLMYYQKPALRNADIHELFPRAGKDTVQRLKRLGREKTNELGNQHWHSLMVNTHDAYLAWGLDIADLEKRYSKLKRLGVET